MQFLHEHRLEVRDLESLFKAIDMKSGITKSSALGHRLRLVFIDDPARLIASDLLFFTYDIKKWMDIR